MLARLIAATALIAALGIPANAQNTRFIVYVVHTGDDAVGESLAYSVREELRRSAGYQVGVLADSTFRISIVSLDQATSGERKGVSSAIAVAYTMANLLPLEKGNPQTWYPIFLTTTVHTIGRDRVETAAKGIVATLDSEVERFREATRR